MSDKVPPPATPPALEDDAPPQHRPNPKVAVVVAGAALAVTIGLTILIIPFVRQAAKLQAQEAALAAEQASRRPRLPPSVPKSASLSAPAPAATKRVPLASLLANSRLRPAEDGRSLPTPEPRPATTAEPLEDDEPEPVEYVSPWLGFQALGVATALVGLSAGLGAFGAAKFLGVNSMEEFAHKMRGSLEGTYPEFIAQVRREGDEPVPDTPVLMDRHGELDEPKFDDWIRGIEAQERAERREHERAVAAVAEEERVRALVERERVLAARQVEREAEREPRDEFAPAPAPAQSDSPVLAAIAARRDEEWAARVATSDERLV